MLEAALKSEDCKVEDSFDLMTLLIETKDSLSGKTKYRTGRDF